MRFASCLILLLLYTFQLTAQKEDLMFSRLDIYSGLSHNQVNALLQDQQGFLWFGTMSGLNRYDGHNLKVFRHSQADAGSIIDNYISSLYELPDNKMWVLTRNTPCIYNAQTEKFSPDVNKYLASLSLPAGNIISITRGDEDRYWFVYDSARLYKYDHRAKKAERFPANGTVAAVKEVSGHLWIVYRDGLIEKADIRSGKVVQTIAALGQLNPGDYNYNIFVDSDNDAWIWVAGTPKGLFQVRQNSIRQLNESTPGLKLNNNLITGMIEDRKGLLWVATDHGGINIIDKKIDHIRYITNDPRDPASISLNSITSLYKDDQGIIWIGTYKKGLNFLNEQIARFRHYHHQESQPGSLPFDDVNRFVEDNKGNLWIGTNGGGLIYFDRSKNSYRQYLHQPGNMNSLGNNVVVSLCIDHTGILWIGTYFGGLSSFDGRTFTHYKNVPSDTTSLSDDRVWEIFEDQNRNLWVGTLGGGLNLFNRKTNSFSRYLPTSYISALMEDRSGRLWVGTAIGLYIYEKGRSSPLLIQDNSTKNSLSNNNVITFLQDSNGQIWVGTREGLNLWNESGKNFEVFTMANGLPDNTILTITEDKQQNLWITTPNGLCKVQPDKGSDGKINLTVTNYDEINNLQGREFNENAALRTASGELIFGGPGGFNIIDPAKISNAPFPPRIVFTGLQVFNQPVDPGQEVNGRVLLPNSLTVSDKLELKYEENVFSVEFASPGYSHATRDKYAYMLEGFSNEWLYADGKQRRATFTNLDPGNYTLKVKMQLADGSWSQPKSLDIHVAPPFWRTPFAMVLYVLTVFGALYLGRRIIIDRARMRFEVQQQRREAERVQAIDRLKTKFFTNVSHEFRTPLSLILAPLEKLISNAGNPDQKKQLHLVQRNAKRLLNLVNQLLDFRKMEVEEIRLHPAIGDIIQFIRDITYSFSDIAEKKQTDLSFGTNIEHLEIYFDRDKMEKILFNLLSNAFKYTPGKGRVAVQLAYDEPVEGQNHGTLHIQVSDSGIGIPSDQHERIFERFFQSEVPAEMVNQGTGIGLAITREFVKLHNGTVTVRSEPEKGTCFTVSLPARKIYQQSPQAEDGLEEFTADQTLEADGQGNGHSSSVKTILVVEDNDDLRFYLKDNLKLQYKVIEAVNGVEGWEKARSLSPDLVVSDVMMPGMDGIELAKRIKGGTPTAHIPVILLTAMGSEERQLEGLQAGVNDYITKPFTFEILASKIRNLLAQQKLLQKRFQKQVEVNPEEITITPLDEQFIKQALAVIERNMDNPDFSVEEFSRDMHMSRVALYKKIVSLTGKAPLEFIRSIRLKRAAQLLQKSGKSISEIAWEVGFNNPKNFSKYFKEEFNVLPSQYAASVKH
ncbi:hybrid sensor histidine kinase/response regulator transcription factor [Flavihumibacter solisilvae]|uniref:histidine kinase n=1 Tax=Flavihumibacter solisilvae TaxID=1349421 RepID=A0A0C1LK74_9BACT|nr:two-component regulator propeller domain-containing protein [Flavihumibacter solisilvae]KIC95778.1 hypothetical protein OI18_03805 [Flavihumibacter solisilvae]